MEQRKIGKSDVSASVICLGAWSIGGGPWWGDSDDQESINAIHASIDAGITFIDTAPGYEWGHSEEVVGMAIKGRRDKVTISTKCGLWWQGEEGGAFYVQKGITVRRSLQPATIKREIEDSLKRLDTDYIDLYITHWPELGDNPTPIAETMNCLMDLKKAGKIRAIGASNTSLDDIREYSKHGQLDAIQERYTMLDRHLEPEYIDLCEELDISIMGYSTIEQGLLTGKITMDTEINDEHFRASLPWYKPENRSKVISVLDGWKDLCAKYDASLAQLVIAWTAAQKGITFPIVGARKIKHAEENAAAGSLQLESEDLTRMRGDVEALGDPA
jgi:methylglyoxal reductase